VCGVAGSLQRPGEGPFFSYSSRWYSGGHRGRETARPGKSRAKKKKTFSQALFFISLLAIDVNIANVDTQLLAFLLGRTLCRAQCVSPPSRWRRGGPDYQATIRGYNRGGGRTSEVADATTCPALGPTDDASIHTSGAVARTTRGL
jgi:hypothetical protein